MSIKQQSQETVHHFWARFLLVKNKIKDCRGEEAILVFRNNCRDEGILNAINRRRILHFADLATIIQKYSAMESAWKTRTARWESSVPTQPFIQAKKGAPLQHARFNNKEIQVQYGAQNRSGRMARWAMQNTRNTG